MAKKQNEIIEIFEKYGYDYRDIDGDRSFGINGVHYKKIADEIVKLFSIKKS